MLQRFLIFATMNNVFDELDINDLLENPDSELKQDMKELAESECNRNTTIYVSFGNMTEIGFKRQLPYLVRWLKQLAWVNGLQQVKVDSIINIIENKEKYYENKLYFKVSIKRFTLVSIIQMFKSLLSCKEVHFIEITSYMTSVQTINKQNFIITKRNGSRQMYLDRNFL